MFFWFRAAELIFWSPCIAGAILAVLADPWYWTVCTAYMAFWALPLTPAVPLQLGLAYGLKKLSGAWKRHRAKKRGEKDDTQAT